MSAELIMLIAILGVILLLATGMWVSIAMGALGLFFFIFFVKGGMVTMLGPLQFNSVNIFTWTPVPLFVFMGAILLNSGIGDKIYKGATPWVSSFPGGLLQTNIFTCALFAGISGSSVADASAIGTVAIPELMKRGYNRRLILGSIAGGGTLGILIPSSIPMIVYGGFVNESIGSLFMAGIIPGFNSSITS